MSNSKMHDILEKLTILQLIVNISNEHYISYLVILPIFDYSEILMYSYGLGGNQRNREYKQHQMARV